MLYVIKYFTDAIFITSTMDLFIRIEEYIALKRRALCEEFEVFVMKDLLHTKSERFDEKDLINIYRTACEKVCSRLIIFINILL